MKKAVLIHGWDGNPENCWFPWLKREFETRGFEVIIPAMPNSDEPKIEEWIPALAEAVGKADRDTVFIGHSIGCQAILRYLETFPENTKVRGVVLVAPWMKLDMKTLEEEGEESIETARPWMETPIDFKKVRKITGKTIAIFSDNDPYVLLNQADIFREKLGAEVIIEQGKGHFDDFANMKELSSVLEAVESLF